MAGRGGVGGRRAWCALGVLVGAGALGIVGQSSVAGAVEAASPPTVRILASGLDPQSVTVAPGDTVVWVNQSGSQRSIIATDASFDSGTLGRGDRFQFAFTEPRTVKYTVTPGAGVTGTVVVALPSDPTAPVPVPTAPTDFAYTGAGSALTGAAGALALALGAGLVLSARRFGAIALSGLAFVLSPDDLLPSRRHRRERKARVRSGRPRR